MANRNHGLSEKEMELVKLLMADCESTGDIQAKLKRLFAGTIEQMLEAEMDEHLGYEKKPRMVSPTFPPFFAKELIQSPTDSQKLFRISFV